MENEVNIRDYINVVVKHWVKIVLAVLIVAFGFAFWSGRKIPVYKAESVILVRVGGGSFASSGLASLAGMAGIDLAGSGGGKLGDIVNLLKSRAVANKVVDDLKLRERITGWDDPEIQDYKLAGAVQGLLKTEPSGSFVTLKVEYTDPELTAEIANGYAQALTYYWNELNFSETRKKREYIESQMPIIRKDLEQAERQLKSFSLLGMEIPSIKLQRLQTEFEIQNAVYTTMRKEYVKVKLEESKEVPLLSVIDEAIVPDKPINKKGKIDIMIGTVMGLFLGMFMAFFAEYWKKTE
jgi:uncharacterized protein involved in exopolysaccharide biosynthesis